MLNVFSDSKLKMSEQIQALQKCAGSSHTRLLFAGPEDESLYMLKPGVIDILDYINRAILFQLPRVKSCFNIQWIFVRIRIATNLLNAQVDSGTMPKEIAIAYHERMTSRIREILGKIYTEDLPFQP